MALSNWDTLALDEKSKPTNGVITSPLGVEVEIYKNWLYIRDKKAWQKGGRYVEPTIATVQFGEMSYKDVQIHAVRGPKEGVYCVVEAGEKDIMVGCGIYGFTGGGRWVGVCKKEVDFLRRWITSYETERMIEPILNIKEYRRKFNSMRKKGDKIICLDGKYYWQYRDYLFDERIRNIKFDKALRVNQGDMFFAANIKGLSPQVTAPGKTKPTHLSGITKAMKKSKEGK